MVRKTKLHSKRDFPTDFGIMLLLNVLLKNVDNENPKFPNSNSKHQWLIILYFRGSEFSSYKIELRNQVRQNYVTLRVTYSNIFIEILLSSY